MLAAAGTLTAKALDRGVDAVADAGDSGCDQGGGLGHRVIDEERAHSEKRHQLRACVVGPVCCNLAA